MMSKNCVFLKILLCLFLVACLCCRKEYGSKELDVEGYRLFDLGVVDFDGDNILDIFTTNCNGLQGLYPGDGQGGFGKSVLTLWRLNHDTVFPGIEDSMEAPDMENPGLYIFLQKKKLNLRAIGGDDGGRFSGSIEMSSMVKINEKSNSEVMLTRSSLASGAKQTKIQFRADKDAKIILQPKYIGIPVRIKLEDAPLKRVFIGRQGINPRSGDFVLNINDRHGMAWADFNGDGLLDVFIARGGLKGKMAIFPERFNDELMCRAGDHFENCTENSGITKNAYRGRQVSWVDYNNDGRLDLYVGNKAHPNRLFRHEQDHTFTDVAPGLGIDSINSGPFVWLDSDNDSDMDLLITKHDAFYLYLNQSGRFEEKIAGKHKSKLNNVCKLTVCDYDLDGDLDVFAASSDRNTLLNNSSGLFNPVDPASIGLPEKSLTANFVDYDNDGLPDLHAIPGGLYLQVPDHAFRQASDLKNVLPEKLANPRCTWLDVNSDGTRDMLFSARTRTRVFFNRPGDTHWLQIKLVGPAGNQQAIGARVTVITGNRSLTQQPGCSEGSHYSQGHYRLYFGLGNHERADAVHVYWPDGSHHEMEDVDADQLLIIRYAE